LGGVHILRYVTKGTTDEWLYGLLSTKAHFITRFMRGEAREYRDEDPSTMSIEEAQIRATNDPRGIELLELRSSVPRLQAQAIAQDRAAARAKADIADLTRTLDARTRQRETFAAFLRDTYRSPIPTFRIGATDYEKAKDANTALQQVITDFAVLERTETVKVGSVGGVSILLNGHPHGAKGYVVNVRFGAEATGGAYQHQVTDLEGKVADRETYATHRNFLASIVDDHKAIPAYLPALDRKIEKARQELATAQEVAGRTSGAAAKTAIEQARGARYERSALFGVVVASPKHDLN